MFAIHASYRGRMRRRSAYVREVVEAFSQSPLSRRWNTKGSKTSSLSPRGWRGGFEPHPGRDFAIGIGTVTGGASAPEEDAEELEKEAIAAAGRAVTRTQKATTVTVRIERPG